jgi:hypothetical protein
LKTDEIKLHTSYHISNIGSHSLLPYPSNIPEDIFHDDLFGFECSEVSGFSWSPIFLYTDGVVLLLLIGCILPGFSSKVCFLFFFFLDWTRVNCSDSEPSSIHSNIGNSTFTAISSSGILSLGSRISTVFYLSKACLASSRSLIISTVSKCISKIATPISSAIAQILSLSKTTKELEQDKFVPSKDLFLEVLVEGYYASSSIALGPCHSA